MDSSTRDFLTRDADILARLETESVRLKRPLLSSLLGIARDEAEDDLRTATAADQAFSNFQRGSETVLSP
jgi:hypothetical protein